VISVENALRWMKRRPHLTMREGPHLYCRDEEWIPKSVPDVLWREGLPYFSVSALARRRNLRHSTTQQWVSRHPHLMIREGKYLFCRDEEWTSRDAGYVAPDLPVEPVPEVSVPEAVRFGVVRKRRKC
jgi:hypothetical protein